MVKSRSAADRQSIGNQSRIGLGVGKRGTMERKRQQPYDRTGYRHLMYDDVKYDVMARTDVLISAELFRKE